MPVVHLPQLTGQVLADVVQREGATAGCLDGWEWRELKVLPAAWSDGLARILSKVEELGLWPEGLLDAHTAMIPKADGDATPLGFGLLLGWCGSRTGSSLGSRTRFSVLVGVVVRWKRGTLLHWTWRRCFLGLFTLISIFFCADVIKSFDTVDRGKYSGSGLEQLGLALLGFRMLTLSSMLMLGCGSSLLLGLVNRGLGMVGSPNGCQLSMMFVVALCLPWCKYLAAQEGAEPQLYADDLNCVSRDPDVLLGAARFTTGYVRLAGQEPAPSKCVL